MTIDVQAHVASLPDPKTGVAPPRVGWTEEGLEAARKDKKVRASYLDPKVHTETLAKYILCTSPLFRADLSKDGDWISTASGRSFYSKKTADYRGSIILPGYDMAQALYVEVKGISPGKTFQFARLDRPSKKGQKSQYDKLDAAFKAKNRVWLMLGWWEALPGAEPIMVPRGSRKVTKWLKSQVSVIFYLFHWNLWLEMLAATEKRSFKYVDMPYTARIEKDGSRWRLYPGHWYSIWRDGALLGL